MTTPQELLREHNPFYSSSAGNPWEDRYPDVQSINREAFEDIFRLVRYKAEHPRDGCGALVFGGAGSGKSHLLKRLLLAVRDMDNPPAFTYLRPILAPEAPMRYLLREIVVNLCKELNNEQTRTQLDLFAASILIDFLRNGQDPAKNAKLLDRLEKDPFHIYRARLNAEALAKAEKRAIRFLKNEIPALEPDLLRVIVKYRKRDTRALVVDWLRGEILDEEESAELGVDSRMDNSPGELEAETSRILLSLGHLMARYRRPMIVCFDQLESLDGPDAIRALEAMVHFLVDQIPAMLPLVFARADSWNNRFKREMDPAAADRLEGNKFQLKGCSRDQARELVSLRLRTFLDDRSDEVVDWLWDRLKGKVKEGYSPRQIIVLANREITSRPSPETHREESKPESSDEAPLLKAYQNECKAVLADLDSWSMDGERLELALESYLKAHPHVTKLRPGNKKYVSFVFHEESEDAQKRPHMVMVNVGGGHQRVAACLRRGIEFLEKYPGGGCYYVSDARSPFPPPPRWKATNNTRDAFEAKGGSVVLLEGQDLANWYALTSLIFKVNEGDVQIEDTDGCLRPAKRNELDEMLRDGCRLGELPQLLRIGDEAPEPEKPEKRGGKTPPPPPEATDEDLIPSIKACLQESPMRMLTVTLLLEKLSRTRTHLDHARLLTLLGRNKSSFRLFENKQGMTVMLEKTS